MVKGDDVRGATKAKARQGQLWAAQESMGETQKKPSQNINSVLPVKMRTIKLPKPMQSKL